MYALNKDVFVRHESELKGKNVFIFVGETNEMFEATEEVYEIICLIKKGCSLSDIAQELSVKYVDSTYKEIFDSVCRIVDLLVDEGVVIPID